MSARPRVPPRPAPHRPTHDDPAALRDSLRRLEAQSWSAYLSELRRLDVSVEEVWSDDWDTPIGQFLRSDASWMPSGITDPDGLPYPSGSPLGGDESGRHIDRWSDVLRLDPCSFCERRESGTVDHIVPKSSPARDTNTWLNLTGCCPGCNVSKKSRPLLLWMRSRARNGSAQFRWDERAAEVAA